MNLSTRRPNIGEDDLEDVIRAMNELAPGAYRARRKKSRIFKAICDSLGVTDDSAGSNFQKLFAQIADEMSSRKIDFKLFLSINPAHFITMSNPKEDERGETLTSCHSLNNLEYKYNNGCVGYARDDVTMIAFTVANPDNAELLNNRKTTRQLFMYKPNNGVLLQIRLYNTSGGTHGAQKDSVLYRDLVQREVSFCENVPNLWKTYSYVKYSADNGFYIHEDGGFGGYTDWIYEDFDAKISFRSDHKDDYKTFRVGKAGLCIKCGNITTTGLYCDNCDNYSCWNCGNYTPSDEMVTAFNRHGEEVRICSDCADEYFGECEDCGRLLPLSCIRYLENLERNVCDSCLREDYDECDCCHEFHHTDYTNYGDYGQICDDCFDNYYSECEVCHKVHHDDFMHRAFDSDGDEIYVCEDCLGDFEQCDVCGDYYEKSVMEDGVCPDCR